MEIQSNRDYALDLVEMGVVDAQYLLVCALKYMSEDDVGDMLDCNELSDRFQDDANYPAEIEEYV